MIAGLTKYQKCGNRIPSATLDPSYPPLPRLPSPPRVLLLPTTLGHLLRYSDPNMRCVLIRKTAMKMTKVHTSWVRGNPSPDMETEHPTIVPNPHRVPKRRIPDFHAWEVVGRTSTRPTRSRVAKRVPRLHFRVWSGEDPALARAPRLCHMKMEKHRRRPRLWPTWQGCLCSPMQGCLQAEQ